MSLHSYYWFQIELTIIVPDHPASWLLIKYFSQSKIEGLWHLHGTCQMKCSKFDQECTQHSWTSFVKLMDCEYQLANNGGWNLSHTMHLQLKIAECTAYSLALGSGCHSTQLSAQCICTWSLFHSCRIPRLHQPYWLQVLWNKPPAPNPRYTSPGRRVRDASVKFTWCLQNILLHFLPYIYDRHYQRKSYFVLLYISMRLLSFLALVHVAVASSTIATFTDTKCQDSFRGFSGPNGCTCILWDSTKHV